MKPITPKFPKLLHGGDYNPEQWLRYPEVLQEDIELMKKADINCVSVGIFSWAHLEPQEGVYDFDWLADVIDNLYKNGIYTVLATPSGAKPLWMSEKYEEIRRVQPSGLRELSGARHNHCYTSPVYREKVREMDRRLAERFANHPGVILWHLSNEYGGECYCPLCQAAFRDWLRKKYKTLDNLNHAWWTDFWSHTYTELVADPRAGAARRDERARPRARLEALCDAPDRRLHGDGARRRKGRQPGDPGDGEPDGLLRRPRLLQVRPGARRRLVGQLPAVAHGGQHGNRRLSPRWRTT